mmetsp:Transcript_17714/g.62074  ORF Transcript_17714/g.62074 Transcript_17714/m.62074 type:complete len:503 (-) Transcript_17714:299-1807(-)
MPPAAAAVPAERQGAVQPEQRAVENEAGLGVLAQDRNLPLDAVPGCVQDDTLCRAAVATSSAALLRIGLQARRHAIVNHTTNIRLVDAHAEGDGGDDDLEVAAVEAILHALLALLAEAGVEGRGAHAAGVEQPGDPVAVLLPPSVDDGRCRVARHRAVQGHRAACLCGGPVHALHPEEFEQPALDAVVVRPLLRGIVDVRPVHGACQEVRLHIRQAKGPHDVSSDIHGTCRCDAHNRRRPPAVACIRDGGSNPAEVAIFGPEMVAPLGDAVRLVHGKQRHPGQARNLAPICVLDEQLRAHVANHHLTLQDLLPSLVRIAALRRADGRRDAALVEAVHLVPHQSHQWRHHQRHRRRPVTSALILMPAARHQRGQHEAPGLPAAGAGDEEAIPTRSPRLHRPALEKLEPAPAKHIPGHIRRHTQRRHLQQGFRFLEDLRLPLRRFIGRPRGLRDGTHDTIGGEVVVGRGSCKPRGLRDGTHDTIGGEVVVGRGSCRQRHSGLQV